MEAFWKAVAVLILTVILGVTLGKTEKDIAIVLTAAACCAVMMVAIRYLSDVVAYLWELVSSTGGQNPFLDTLLKIAGVALVTELTGMLSADAGNHSLGKAVQILGNAAILFLSLPIFRSFFSIFQEILGIL